MQIASVSWVGDTRPGDSSTPTIHFKRFAQERRMQEIGQKAEENWSRGKEATTDKD